MFCGTRPSLRIPIGTNPQEQLKAREAIGQRRVFGTWDFKWPQGSKIRVAFQRLPVDHPAMEGFDLSDDYQRELFRHVRDGARGWLEAVDGKRPNIDMVFFDEKAEDWWPAPTLPRWAKSGRGEGHAYDVLVSLTPLDLVQEPDSDEQPIGALHRFPRAQLGTYSRRVPLRVPTVYLGRPFYMREGARNHIPVAEYFEHEQFAHCIVHEFGHVLGLAHEHQNPKATPKWKSARDIADILLEETGMSREEFVAGAPQGETLESFISSQIRDPWPITKVPEDKENLYRFSDWREPPQEKPDGGYDFDSIMTDPMWRRFVTHEGVVNAIIANPELKTLFNLDAPTRSDLVQLEKMYPDPAHRPQR